MGIKDRIFGINKVSTSGQEKPLIMLQDGAVILIGPEKQRKLFSKGLQNDLTAEASRIGELNLSNTEVQRMMIVFIHYIPWLKGKAAYDRDLEKWSSAFVEGISFTPEDNLNISMEMTCNKQNDIITFILRWKNVNTQSILRLTTAFEDSFIKLGGLYK